MRKMEAQLSRGHEMGQSGLLHCRHRLSKKSKGGRNRILRELSKAEQLCVPGF